MILGVCFVTVAGVSVRVWVRRLEEGGLTCHYGAHQEEDTEEYVSCQCAEAVHDLPLADGEENSKDLRKWERSGAELLAIQTDPELLSLTCAEQLRRPDEVPSDSGYVSSTANSKPRGR